MWEGVGDQTELPHIDPHSYGHQCFFPVLLILLNRRPGGPLCWVLASSTASCHQRVWSPKLTDFLSSPSYIIVQSPTQYLPITGHRNVSLPPSLEWHVWSSSSRNNCHAVHRSLSSGASVCGCTAGFYLVPYCQPSPPTQFLPITGHQSVSLPPSLEWHVWPGRRSIYNTTLAGSLLQAEERNQIMLSDNTCHQDLSKSRLLLWVKSSTNQEVLLFVFLLTEVNHSLNLNISFFFSLFMSNLMATTKINFPPNSLVVKFSKSLSDFNIPHSPFVYKHAVIPTQYQSNTLLSYHNVIKEIKSSIFIPEESKICMVKWDQRAQTYLMISSPDVWFVLLLPTFAVLLRRMHVVNLLVICMCEQVAQ